MLFLDLLEPDWVPNWFVERLSHRPPPAAQNADIWSCGIILYAMLYGCHPFSPKDPDYLSKMRSMQYQLHPDIAVRPQHSCYAYCMPSVMHLQRSSFVLYSLLVGKLSLKDLSRYNCRLKATGK